jgi:hypothetical protein
MWVLAFDAGCSACRDISRSVEEAGAGKLTVLPLAHPDVRAVLGPDAPWTPTLLRLGGSRPRTWTGTGMAVRLARLLGPRASTRVLRALGTRRLADRPDGLGRKQFLRLGVGALVAGGMILAGRLPAFGAEATKWVAANRANLPTTYDDFARFAVPYREAICAALSPETRSRLWTEHVRRFRAANPNPTAAQAAVLDRVATLAADPATFGGARPDDAGLVESAIAAYGKDTAAALLATLGPAAPQSPDEYCNCSTESDWCGPSAGCLDIGCIQQDHCGSFWAYKCDGHCVLIP